MDEKPGVVLDTGVVLQAALNPSGPAARLLDLLDQGLFCLHVREDLLAEYEEVLRRPSIRRKNPQLNERLALAIVGRIRRQAKMAAKVGTLFALPRNPGDEHVVSLALEVGARYLISWDRDLLDLMEQDRPERAQFRSQFPRLRVLDPVDFIKELEP